MGAAISGLLLHIGDRLGLYKAMAGAGPITSSTLAARTGTAERYVREWLGNQAAGGYVVYNPADSTFELPAEQAMVVADEDSPVFLGRSSCAPSRASPPATPTTTSSWTRSVPAPGSAGRSTTTGCSPASCGCSVPATPPISWTNGSLPWTAWWRSGRARASRTSGAGSARPRSSWRRHSSGRRSSASTSTKPSIDRRPRGGCGGRRGPAGEIRRRDRQGASRHRLRPGLHVRLPARHGRSGRGCPPYPAGAGAGRHAAAGRAAGRRRAGAQPEPGRANLLRLLHRRVHTCVAGAGGRPGARRAGR